MKAKAEEYSFNIESQLFPTLNAEQQKLWKAEIEQAYMAGAGVNTQDQIDALRMEYEKGYHDGHKKAVTDAYKWLRKNANHYVNSVYPIDEDLYEDFKQYLEEQ